MPESLKRHKRDMLMHVLSSRADSTTRRYILEIKKFFSWSREENIAVQLPYPCVVSAIYLSELYKQTKSSASVSVAYCALKWLHTFIPEENPLDNDLCRNIVESTRRKKVTPKSKKTPISADIIRKIIDKYAGPDCTLMELRTATICTIGFAGFLRYNEICNILPIHLTFFEEFVTILIPGSKTDVYREGNVVYINNLDNKYCPVKLLRRYLSAANIDLRSDMPLFRAVTYHKKSKSYSLRNKTSLSYTRCREIFKTCLKDIGEDPTLFGLHSLRSGGITSVVRNSNNSVSDRLLKLHGRWKTDIAKDMYVHEDIQKRLEVTKFLGL